MSESQLFIAAIYKGDIYEIYRALRRTNVHPYTCTDNRGHTAIHIASLGGHLSVINFLTDYVINIKVKFRYKIEADDILSFWVNLKTDEGFLAAHFASFKGHIVRI